MPTFSNPFLTGVVDSTQDFNITPGSIVLEDWEGLSAIPAPSPNAQAMMAELDMTHAELKMKIDMAKTKQKIAAQKSAYPNELKYPLIPEVNPDGTKALWKTRYDRLESSYGVLHQDFKNFEKGYWEQLDKCDEYMTAIVKLDKEVKTLKMANVDSEVVQKRMDQVCKELGIQLPPLRFNSMEQRLNAFFGAIWVRLRVEVKDDTLAE